MEVWNDDRGQRQLTEQPETRWTGHLDSDNDLHQQQPVLDALQMELSNDDWSQRQLTAQPEAWWVTRPDSDNVQRQPGTVSDSCTGQIQPIQGQNNVRSKALQKVIHCKKVRVRNYADKDLNREVAGQNHTDGEKRAAFSTRNSEQQVFILPKRTFIWFIWSSIICI